MEKWIKGLLTFVAMVLLSSCYDSRELNQTGFVTALGIDLGQHAEYRISVQVVNPNISGGKTECGTSGGPNTLTYAATGDNIFEATRKITKRISRKLHYGHTFLIVISEEAARENGLISLFDGIERDSELQTSASVILTRGIGAEKFLATKATLDRVSGMQVKRIVRNTQNFLGENIDGKLYRIIRTLTSPGRDPFMNGIEVIQRPHGNISMVNGIGVFRHDKLAGWIDAKTSRGVMWVLGKIESTLINLDVKGVKNGVGIETVRVKTHVEADNRNGKPIILIRIKVQSNVGEVNANIDVMDPKVILSLEKLTEQAIQREVERSISRLQSMKSDIFGFGDIVHRYQPALWNKVKHDWSENTFPSLQYDVNVIVNIHLLGMRKNPLIQGVQ